MRCRLIALTAAMLVATPAAAQAADGDIIVQHVPGLDSAEQRDMRKDAGVKLVDTLTAVEDTQLVKAPPGRRDEALSALRADDDVVYAEFDQRVTLTRIPDDTAFGSLWGLRNTGQSIALQAGVAGADIDATEAWDQTMGAGATVAVVDTGINADHVDLADQVTGVQAEIDGEPGVDDDHNGYVDDYRGWDFVNDDNLPQDGNGHGTHVSGTIAAKGENTTGVIGVAPAAKILPLRVLGNSGSGFMSDIASAFAYAGDLGIRVVNASIGGGYSKVLENTIAAHPNTLYVVAAGNDGANADTDSLSYPCRMPEANIVCVGATDNRDELASFSNRGKTAVDLFAPGVSIYSTYRGFATSYLYLSGTSMATPHVSGAAALALSATPSASTAFLRWSLLSSVDAKPALGAISVTGGRLNANAAVTAIKGEPPAPASTPIEEPPVPTPTPTPMPEPPAATPVPVAPIVTPVVTPTPAPVLSKVSVTGSLRTKKAKLRVSFSLDRSTWVRFSITRRGTKRPLATWSVRARASRNAVTFTRKLPTGRTLKPGAYTLAVGLSASPAASSSKLIRVP